MIWIKFYFMIVLILLIVIMGIFIIHNTYSDAYNAGQMIMVMK